MVYTNSDPSDIDFVIPANDDASKSISLIVDLLCKAIDEGLNERKLEKDKEPGLKDKRVIRKELETEALPTAIIEAIVEEEEEVEVDDEVESVHIDEDELVADDSEVDEIEEEDTKL
jgi:small subunit ribosomal protein S2